MLIDELAALSQVGAFVVAAAVGVWSLAHGGGRLPGAQPGSSERTTCLDSTVQGGGCVPVELVCLPVMYQPASGSGIHGRVVISIEPEVDVAAVLPVRCASTCWDRRRVFTVVECDSSSGDVGPIGVDRTPEPVSVLGRHGARKR